MSIGILVTALLMVIMPDKCKNEAAKSAKQYKLIHDATDYNTTIFDYFNATSSYGLTTSRITTTEIYTTETFVAKNASEVFAKRSDSKNENLVTALWPVKHAAELNGDLILGGLMMIHEREDSVTCGPIMPQGGIQALETMLYTLDVINKMGILPNITMGAHILDDCDKDTYGLEMAVDFIKEVKDALDRDQWRRIIRSRLELDTNYDPQT